MPALVTHSTKTAVSLPVFVINLPAQRARRAFMLLQLRALGMETTIWPAIDGARLSEDERAAHYNDARAKSHRRSLTTGEIACALSHIGIYRHMVGRDMPYAMILEDDAVLNRFTRSVLDGVEPMLQTNHPTIVLLTHLSRFCMRGNKKITAHHRLVRVWKAGHGFGYLINKAAARSLSSELYPVFTTADNWTRLRRHSKQIALWGVDPYCIGQSVLDAASTLEPDRAPMRSPRGKGAHVAGRSRIRTVAARAWVQLFLKPWYRIKRQTSTW